MATDDPIEPISLDAAARISPIKLDAATPVEPTRSTEPTPPTEQLGDALERSLILDDSQYPDPNSIGQILGGAAAAAYSGQASRIEFRGSANDERTAHAEDPTSELDPLAAVPRMTDDDEDDRRRRQLLERAFREDLEPRDDDLK